MSRPVPRKKSTGAKESASAVGEVIADKYKVLRVLGQGGFGTVYLVEITAGMVGERLALKVLTGEFSSNAAVRDQFLNEIRVAMKMVDRFIVQIRDVGTTADGRLYYTMDYCGGKSLLQVLREETRLPWRRAVLIILKVLRALRTAHSRGIIHRDLKPANIMVETENGRDSVRVLDFGIATALRGDSERAKGGISGSPPYMPPEQFLGEKLGFYTDLYAVGAMLYECLAGQRPYPGRSAKEIFDGLKRGPPVPPEELNPELIECPALSPIVMKALERNPERRFQNPREFFDELGSLLSDDGADAPAPAGAGQRAPVGAARRSVGPRAAARRPGRRRQRLGVGPWILLLLVVMAAGVVAFVLRDRLGLSDRFSGLLPSLAPPPPSAAESPAGPASPEGPTVEAPSPGEGASPEPTTAEPPPRDPRGTDAVVADTGEGAGSEDTPREQPGLETRKPDLDELLVAAAEAFEEGDWESVLELAATVIDSDSANARALRLLGDAHARLGDLEDAERYLEKARALSLADAALLLELARVKTRKTPPDWAAAESLLESAQRFQGYDDPAISALLAKALEEQQKRGELRRLLIATRERELDFPGFQTYWTEILVEAPAALWTETRRAGQAARDAHAGGEIEPALRSATQVIRLARELEEYGAYAPNGEAKPLALEMRILSAEIAIRDPEIAGLDADSIGLLLGPVSLAVKESPDALPPAAVMRWSYLLGRLELLAYDAKPSKSTLDAAESRLNEARRLAESGDRRDRDAGFLAAVHSWLARVYAHRADPTRVRDHLMSARDVTDLEEIYEQARTYFLAGMKTRARQRIESYQNAADRLENITNQSRADVPGELYASSLDLLGQCYLMLGRYEEKQRRFVYAANKLVEARNEGRRTPELYRNLGTAYEEFNLIKAAQTYRELYEQIQPSVCNCLLAAEVYIRATENTREARNIVTDGLNRFRGRARKPLERALSAMESTRNRRTGDLVGEIEKLRRIACK